MNDKANALHRCKNFYLLTERSSFLDRCVVRRAVARCLAFDVVCASTSSSSTDVVRAVFRLVECQSLAREDAKQRRLTFNKRLKIWTRKKCFFSLSPRQQKSCFEDIGKRRRHQSNCDNMGELLPSSSN